jgi:hypothetical protein
MGEEQYHDIDKVSTDNLRSRTIAGATMWDKAVGPTIERSFRSYSLLPRVPLLQLLLTAPDGVTGGASFAGMWCHAPRLRQLARQAQLCASLRPQISRVDSAKGRHDKADGLIAVFIYVLSVENGKISETLFTVDFGTNSTYEHSHMPKINSSSVKICESSRPHLARVSPKNSQLLPAP